MPCSCQSRHWVGVTNNPPTPNRSMACCTVTAGAPKKTCRKCTAICLSLTATRASHTSLPFVPTYHTPHALCRCIPSPPPPHTLPTRAKATRHPKSQHPPCQPLPETRPHRKLLLGGGSHHTYATADNNRHLTPGERSPQNPLLCFVQKICLQCACTAVHRLPLVKSHKGRGCCSLSWCPNSRLDVWAATCTVCVLHTLLMPQSKTTTCIQPPLSAPETL